MTWRCSALRLPLFNELADPAVVADLATEAQEAGWHGVLVWDHLRWRAPALQVADPWITLAAIAAATERLQLSPMVTAFARLILGAGLGSDRFGGELSATGEQLDDRQRGQMLDEPLEILSAAWSGQPVYHHGAHYTIDGLQFLARPVQQPGCRCGSRVFPAMPGHCAGPPATTASSQSTLSTPTSLPRSPPSSTAAGSTRPRRATLPCPAARHRPGALCHGRRYVVADGARGRASLYRPGTRRAPRLSGGSRSSDIRGQGKPERPVRRGFAGIG